MKYPVTVKSYMSKNKPRDMGANYLSKTRQKDIRNKHNQLCIAKSVVAISNFADELIKCKNDKSL